MRQTWRWFGPEDLASIDTMVQAGVEGVVTALHHVPTGKVWTPEEIARRQALLRVMTDGSPSGLEWEVVESLPVSENIKKQKGAWREDIAAYCQSLKNLSAAGIEVVCYNFMPLLDWTRTDLHWKLPHGGSCMRFDLVDFAVFDIHLLKRKGAAEGFSAEIIEQAAKRFETSTSEWQTRLTQNIIAGLPGTNERLTLSDVEDHLAEYASIDEDQMRANFVDFLEQVVPVAEELGVRLCCHPDDPPFPLLGLPRIMSTEAHYTAVMNAVDSPANGITLCTGSLGARADNDLPGMMERLGSRVHFLHLRNVRREASVVPLSFFESEHLGGDVNMAKVLSVVLKEESRRKAAGREDHQIPMRPDHGHDILDDIGRHSQPGYPTIGRLKGLAELRGVVAGLSLAE